jgi:hypothetical protein
VPGSPSGRGLIRKPNVTDFSEHACTITPTSRTSP